MNKHLFLLFLLQISTFWAYGQCGGNPQAIFTTAINATPSGSTACNGQTMAYNFTASPSTGSHLIYAWNFGQPSSGASNTATGATSTHTFGSNSNSFNAGTYTVTLIVTDTLGIDSCDMATFVVNTGPISGTFPLSFTATPSATSCNGQPNQYTFTPSVTGNQYIYSWIFGQSGATNTSTLANPTHTFGSNSNSFNPSTYNVTLYVIDTVGKDTCKMVAQNVSSNPIMGNAANFTWSPNSPCSGTTAINFSGSPSSNNQNKYIYSWNFAGLGTASIKNPSFTFPFNASPQTYTVSFMAIDTTGKDTCRFAQNNITVGGGIPIDVDSITTSFNQCIMGLSATQDTLTSAFFITNPSTGTFSWTIAKLPNGTPVSGTTTTNSFSYFFHGFGSYLISVYQPGSTCPGFQKMFRFYTNPTAAMQLVSNSYVCEGDTVIAKNNTIPGTADSFIWDWGDGTTTQVQDTSRQKHLYAITNPPNLCPITTFNIILTASNACFAPHTNSSPTYIKSKLNPVFSYSGTPCINQTITFTNTTCQPSVSGAMSYTWNFGDGSPLVTNNSNTISPTHIYTQPGTFIITLIASKANYCASGTTTSTITIYPPPTLNITASPHNACKPLVVNFSNNSTPANNTYSMTVVSTPANLSYSTQGSISSPNFQMTFNAVGMYVVTMTATNTCGTATWKDTFYVKDKPIINYTPTPDQCLTAGVSSLTLNFSATPNANGGTLNPANPTWTFTGGIPNTASGTTVGSITFGAGIFPITVSSTNECGTTIERDTFVVRAFPNAAASFAFSNTNYCVSTGNPLVVNCTNLTMPTGAIYNYTWSWTAPGASPTPSTLQNPTFTYPVITYNTTNVITLYATNQCGTDTLQKQILIKNAPTVSLATIPNVCLVAPNTSVNITPAPTYNLGNTANPTYSWTFTTGTISPNPNSNPTANFAAGNHTAQIIVSNECGSATASRSFIVTDFAQANATYTLSDTNYCTFAAQPLTVSFTGQAAPTGSTYAWSSTSSATPSSATSANPVFTYPPNLTYNGTNSITLTVTPPNNCPAATANYTFRVKKAPVITTAPDIQDQCLAVGTTSINITPAPTATYNVGNSINPTYTWTFSGGCTPPTSNVANPTGISTPLGGHNFVVSLKNECGTVSSADTFTLRTIPTANASLSFAPTNNCATAGNPLIVTATNLSTNTTWSTNPNWTVTNGTFVPPSTNTSQNPVFSFSSSGNASVSLTYTNVCGSSPWTQSFPVKTVPTVTINTLGSPCLNGSSTTVTLNPTANFVANNGTFGANAFSWNFGTTPGISPQSSTSQIPGSVIFPAGNHPYSASATNECGTTTANASVVIGDFPHANATFTANNIDSCASIATPFSLSFTSLSTPVGGITYSWVVNPPTGVSPAATSSSPNPTFDFTQSGTYTVTLTVGNGCGSHQWIKVFHIKQKPTVTLAPISNVCLVSPNTSVNLTPSPNYALGGSSNVTYSWTYTGGTSTSQNLGATNFTAGNHTIKIKVGNECGSDSASRSFTVTDFPQAIATIAPSNVNYCTSVVTPLTVSFTGQALPSGATYNWSAPSANLPNTSTLANPTFSYANAGTNNIVLTVTAPNGCPTTSQVTYPISVKTTPTVLLGNIPPQCLTANSTTVNVTPLASYTLGNSTNNSYDWTFSNCLPNTAITQVAPTISCPSGVHNVQIIVANECGSDTANTNFTVTPFPVANASLTFNPTSNCATSGSPLVVTATNLSTPAGATSLWNPGAGGSFVSPSNASSPNPTFSYTTNGTPTISLSYTNICGTANWSQNITVKTLPTVTIDSLGATCLTGASSTISLNPSASYGNGGGTISAYSWNFGTAVGMNPPPYITQNPGAINFPAGNNHYWTSVTNECGTSVANDSVLVGDFPHANASFVINNLDTCTSTTTPFSVSFTSLSTPVGGIAHSWVVNPPTGVLPAATSSSPNPTFNFTQSGTYTVTLTVGNGCGSHQWIKVFHIKQKPTVTLAAISNVCLVSPNTSVNLTPSPNYASGGSSNLTYLWTYTGGTSTSQNLGATNFTAGNHTIKIKVGNECGSDSASSSFTVTDFPQAIATIAPSNVNYCTSAATPLMVSFTGQALPGGATYSWSAPSANLPNTSALANPTFSYANAGTNNIVLTVTAPNNCPTTSQATYPISVKTLPTVASNHISAACLTGASSTISLNPSASYGNGGGTISAYSWNFGTAVGVNPPPYITQNPGAINFPAGNNHYWTSVTNECGTSVANDSVLVGDFPHANASFVINNLDTCTSTTTPFSVSFTSLSTPIGGIAHSWVVNPPTGVLPSATSSSPNPTFNFTQSGTYTVTLTVGNGCGSHQWIKVFHIKQKPTVTLAAISNVCLVSPNTSVNLTPSPNYASGGSSNLTYLWTYTGGTSTSQNLGATNFTAGNHTIKIKIGNECGSDSASSSFTVTDFPQAIATITPSNVNYCTSAATPLTVSFTGQALPSGATYSWSAPSANLPNTSALANPTFSYVNAGINNIVLTVTAPNNCPTTSQATYPISVKTLPTVASNHISAACLTGVSSTISLNPSASYGNGGGTISAYSWNFGTAVGVNPPPYITQNPGVINFPAGNNHYWTSVTNECGTSVANDSVLVGDFPHANASFVINNLDTCTNTTTPFSVSFTSLSTPIGGIAHSWVVNPPTGVLPSATSSSPNPTFEFTQSGTYTVTLTVGNGCGSHQWIKVFHVKARPDISLVPIQDLCLGAGVTSQSFTPNPSYTDNGAAITAYNWTFQTALNNPPTNIDYPTNVIFGQGNNVITVIAQNVCGKDTASEGFTITAFPHASAILTVNDANICTYSATPFQLTLNSNSTPSALNCNISATPQSATQNGNTITFPSTGLLSITLSCSNICGVDDTTFTYDVHALPTVDVPFIPDGCGFVQFNPSATITYGNTDSSAASYNWQFQNGAPFSSASLNPGTVTFSPIICAVSLTVTNVCGSVNDVSNFNVVGAATLVGSDDTVLCSNVAPISIHCAPAGGQWNNVVSNVNIVGNQSFATFTPAVAGTYYAIYTYGAGNCLRIDTVKIIVNAAPNVDAGLPFAICADAAAVTLSGTPSGGCFTGSGMINCTQFNPTTVAPSVSPYNITYTFTDANQCTSSDQVQITVNPLPVVNAGLDTTFCFTSTPQILVGNSPANGFWSNNIGISNAATGEFIPFVAGVGNHTLLYTFTNGNGCVNKDSIVAHVILKDSIDAGADQSICLNGGILALTGYYPLSNAVWTGSGVSGNTFDPLITGVTSVTLTYTTGSGSCQTTDTKNVTVFPVPSVNAGQIVSTCVSDSVVNLANGTPLGGYWTGFTVNNNQFFPNTAGIGTYPITYHFADGNGCIDSNVTTIIVNPLPQVQFTVPLVSCKGSPVSFNNQSTGVTQYAWHFGDGGTSFAQNPTHVYADTGHFEVTLIGTSGSSCVDSMKFTLQIIDVPSPSFLMTPDTACSSILANGTGVMASFIDNSLNWGGTYNWNFGNLQNSTLQNPPPVFFPEGLNDTAYVITLDIGNMCGTATFKDTLHILSQPKAIFGTNVNSGCSPAPFLMANISQGGPTAWSWIFGNGNTSTVQNPSVQYYLIGASNLDTTYTITLIASNMCGADTATHQVTVHPNTVNAFFNANPIAGCAPLTVNVTNFSNGNTVSYNMGPAVANPTIIFPNAGTYVIKQYANNGCSYDTAAVTITVNAAPIVSFASQPIICQGDTANFTNNTQNAVSYSWNFGDNTTLGDTSNAVNPLYIYPTAGNQVVTLTAYANTTLCKASASQTINVKPAPSIDFALSDTIGCAAFVVNVLNNTSSGAFHFWDFGAAFPNTSSSANPTFACQTQGTYPIHYTNTDGFGCHADTTFSVVAVEKPLAAFTPSALSACGIPATFNFSNQSTGTNIAYSWNFGNAVGTQSNLPTPSITYTNTGTFTVTLIVGNNFGCSDTLQIPITIYPQPDANFSISPTQGCAPLTVTFANTTTNATNYTWTFGNGSPINTSFAPPAQTYLVQNSYPITLHVNYQNQCFDSATITLPVLPPPVANFNFSTSGNICGGAYTLNFNNLSQNGSVYSWNFGDGGTDTLTNPIHTYNGAGTYIISLTALNGVNCLHTFKDTIVVHPQPSANVLVQPTVGCAPLTTTFVNLSTNYTTTSWYYGDNSTPSPFVGNSSPSHTYAIPDTYYLQVITNYQNVCFDTVTVPITVVPLPIANFTYSPTSVVCGAPAPFTFVNSSQMAQNYFWTFGNGVQTAAFDTSIVYQTTGIFPVTLVATNYLGCSHTVTQNITVNPQPNASFSLSPTQGCAPLTVNVTNTTTNATNYSWDWGNAALSNSTLQNPPAQIYNTVGNGTPPSYTITLYANYQNQCFDTTSVTIPVVPQPISDFNFTTSGTHCGGPYTLTFNNLSQHSNHYSWNFGNNVTDTLANPTYTYNSAGIYIISLSAYNDYGCAHTSFDTITVYPQPQASLLVQPTTGCVPFTTTFVNLSTNYTTTSWYYGDNSAPFVGNTSPSHIYPTPDTYYVQIIVNQQNMCFDTATVPIIAVPLPVANFTYAPTSVVCGVPAPFTFTNLSQFAQNYYWDFGNGITTTAFDTTVIYTAADTFTITLISSNALGCKDTMTQNIIVNPQPQANVTALPSQGCAPLTVNFTNNSTYCTHAIWNYQDGSATQNTNGAIGITHIFTPVDTFNVTVIVDYEGVCFDTTIVPVIVQPQPLASFTSSESGTHCGGPLTINLQSTTLYATTYLWYLGNGNTSTTQNTSVTYTVADTFTVTLVATNAVGCKDTISKDFILHPQPQALANATPTVACVPATLTVQNLSTIATAWTWNFGDGTAEETAFVPMPHTYFVPANDTLTLIANYQNVCFDTLRVPLAYGDRPSAIFAFSVSGDLCGGPAKIVTDNQSTLANTYLWNFGDSLNYSTQFNDSVIYTTAGDYLISLIATNDYCSDTTSQNYHLYDQVTANFIADTLAGCNPQPIAFSSTSINATDFAWYFGDTTSSIQNPVLHTYQDSGTYTVTLIASIGGVCPDTITKTGLIHINQSPIAAFDMQPEQTGSFDNVIHFINTTQFANQYFWDLGDGTTTTMETPEPHAYLTNDTVYATLIAINEHGCTDTLVKYVSMKPVYGLQIPNAFAPYSGVAKANVFMPIGYGLKEYEIAVYSTWGDLVWSSTAIDAEGRPTETWDGKDRNGNPMNSDVFVWEVHKAVFIGNVEWEGMKYGRKKEKAHRTGTLTIVK